MDKELPHLRFCVNAECNFSCFYCTPGGENGITSPSAIMGLDEVRNILVMAREYGFTCVKFTGGEPLLRKDILDVLDGAFEIGFPNVEIVTNGYRLSEFAGEPNFRKLGLLTVSLNSLNPETYRLFTKKDCLNLVLDGIKKASKAGIPLRINMILCKQNKNELKDFIEFARTMNAELKIHELLEFRLQEPDLWYRHFVPPSEITPILEALPHKKETVLGEGGYGSPMIRYYIRDGPKILVYDSNRGVRYSNMCKSCKQFPCQDGLYGLRVTHKGELKLCWGRDDTNLDILTPSKSGDEAVVYALFEEAVKTFANSQLSFERREFANQVGWKAK